MFGERNVYFLNNLLFVCFIALIKIGRYSWRMLSLGRGFYEFSFAFHDDLHTVWSAGTINLKPRLLQLFEWMKDFNIHTQ